MRKLAALLLGSCLFIFGCSGDGGGGASTDTGGASSGTEVAKNCPGCGKELVDGKCAA